MNPSLLWHWCWHQRSCTEEEQPSKVTSPPAFLGEENSVDFSSFCSFWCEKRHEKLRPVRLPNLKQQSWKSMMLPQSLSEIYDCGGKTAKSILTTAAWHWTGPAHSDQTPYLGTQRMELLGNPNLQVHQHINVHNSEVCPFCQSAKGTEKWSLILHCNFWTTLTLIHLLDHQKLLQVNAGVRTCSCSDARHHHDYQRGIEEEIQHNLVFLKSSCILILVIFGWSKVVLEKERRREKGHGRKGGGRSVVVVVGHDLNA